MMRKFTFVKEETNRWYVVLPEWEGDKKQQAIDTVASLEEKHNSLVMELIKPFLLEDESAKTIAV